jgi:hypothetical protein
VFGHTHRPGPLPDDDPAEWTTPSGTRLWNCGNWFKDPALVGDSTARSPYRPGTMVIVDHAGPPRVENVLVARR